MIKKLIILAVSTIVVIVAVYAVSLDGSSYYPDYFDINATYYDATATVQFTDNSRGTQQVSIEIQGMKETLFRTYKSHNFTYDVPFSTPPRHGWGVHPIILYISHDTLGNVTLKTEFSNVGQEPADVLLVRP